MSFGVLCPSANSYCAVYLFEIYLLYFPYSFTMSTTVNNSEDSSSPLDFCKKVKEKVECIFESLQSVPTALPPLRRKRVAVDIQHAEYMARLESFSKVVSLLFNASAGIYGTLYSHPDSYINPLIFIQ